MLGMHARVGTLDSAMCHTNPTTTWRRVFFNDDNVGAFRINAALFGHYGYPAVRVAQDEATRRESRE